MYCVVFTNMIMYNFLAINFFQQKLYIFTYSGPALIQ